MNQRQAIRVLRALDDAGRYVFRRQHLRTCFHEDSEKTFAAGLARLVDTGVLTRAGRAVYVHDAAKSRDGYTIERIAIALRPAELSYISLESALAEYGVISQIPIDRITLMTTGREGEIRTPYGTIEFVHTKRDPADLRQATLSSDHPLRMAKIDTAIRDLRRVGRNLHLIDPEALQEALAKP
ncbi:hypothetical protein BN940_10576 [Castellaniella defragrans 65Phen]|uniref:AbiEi antitoxin C-terminal domain-containing protein n=2 Tax=Castellaniella defragrans TaxID=75697 RepID=W8X9C3_CASD6|nr:hypothetical protein [Castellaniella defragrans]KAB0622507.1 hypothetical protein F7Q88_03225 [Castellaniella defragrans]MBB6084814.1 hypothetical protein [Castellaniella defragrans]CDM24575.1 hypothetical protein BN940_10576 [Castellaniella defragrans 65Phen]